MPDEHLDPQQREIILSGILDGQPLGGDDGIFRSLAVSDRVLLNTLRNDEEFRAELYEAVAWMENMRRIDAWSTFAAPIDGSPDQQKVEVDRRKMLLTLLRYNQGVAKGLVDGTPKKAEDDGSVDPFDALLKQAEDEDWQSPSRNSPSKPGGGV